MTTPYQTLPFLTVDAYFSESLIPLDLVTTKIYVTVTNNGSAPATNVQVAANAQTGWSYTDAWSGATSGITINPGATYTVSRTIQVATPGFYEIPVHASGSHAGVTSSADSIGKLVAWSTAGPGAGAAWVDYGTVWANGFQGQDVRTSLVLRNESPYPVTLPVIAMLPFKCSQMSVRLMHEPGAAVTSLLKKSSEVGVYVASGPISDTIVIPHYTTVRYDFIYTLERGLPLETTIDIVVNVGGKNYTTPTYVRKDIVCEPRGSMNPSRIQEMLFGVESEAAESMLGTLVYDFLTEGGTLWHLIADLVSRRGSPAYWPKVDVPPGDQYPNWYDWAAFKNPHPFIAP